MRGGIAVLFAALLLVAGASSGGQPAAAAEKPVLYLTFDDGPSIDGGTAAVLEVLARYNIKATFFVVGTRVDSDPASVRRVVAEGHAIANHSYSHTDLTTLDAAGVASELSKTQAAIARAGVAPPSCFRPPYGGTNLVVRGIATELGLTEQLWNLNTLDWQRGPAEAVTASLNTARPDDVVLLHDGWNGGATTAQALDDFLRARASDFDFRMISSCVGGSDTPTTTTTPVTTTTTGPVTTTTTAPVVTTTTAPVATTTVPVSTTTTTAAPAPAGPTTLEDCRSGPQGALVHRYDPLEGSIFRLYCAYLARFPEDTGFHYWRGVADAEVSIRPISDFFASSPEFVQHYGLLTNEQFVTLIYRNVFNRSPDPAGSTYWLGLLNQSAASRGEVMLQFSESEEFRLQTSTA